MSYLVAIPLWLLSLTEAINMFDQSSPNAELPVAKHCNYLSGVAVSCQVKGNII